MIGPSPRTLLGPLPCSLISLRAPRLTPSQISRNEITAFPSILYPGVTTAPGNLYHTYKTDMTQFLLRISKKRRSGLYRTACEQPRGKCAGSIRSVVMRHRGVPESCRYAVVSCEDDEDEELFLEAPGGATRAHDLKLLRQSINRLFRIRATIDRRLRESRYLICSNRVPVGWDRQRSFFSSDNRVVRCILERKGRRILALSLALASISLSL